MASVPPSRAFGSPGKRGRTGTLPARVPAGRAPAAPARQSFAAKLERWEEAAESHVLPGTESSLHAPPVALAHAGRGGSACLAAALALGRAPADARAGPAKRTDKFRGRTGGSHSGIGSCSGDAGAAELARGGRLRADARGWPAERMDRLLVRAGCAHDDGAGESPGVVSANVPARAKRLRVDARGGPVERTDRFLGRTGGTHGGVGESPGGVGAAELARGQHAGAEQRQHTAPGVRAPAATSSQWARLASQCASSARASGTQSASSLSVGRTVSPARGRMAAAAVGG